MPSDTSRRFMKALQEIEKTRQVEPMLEVFHEEGDASNLTAHHSFQGREGIRTFWQDYLHAFKEIRSEFSTVIENECATVLEWKSEGVLRTGVPVSYKGVSVLEVEDGRVSHFRAYYDTAALLPLAAKKPSAA